jgi:hypothetical protein
VRHHTQHIAILIADAGDIRACAVWVRSRGYLAIFVAVSKNDLAVFFERVERCVVADEVAVGVGDRDRKYAAIT